MYLHRWHFVIVQICISIFFNAGLRSTRRRWQSMWRNTQQRTPSGRLIRFGLFVFSGIFACIVLYFAIMGDSVYAYFFRRTSPLPPRARCRTFLRTRRKTWNYNLKASWGTSLPPPEDCHSDSSPQWNVLSQAGSQHYCRCFHWSVMVTRAPLWDSHSTVLCYLVSIYVDIKERWREVF